MVRHAERFDQESQGFAVVFDSHEFPGGITRLVREGEVVGGEGADAAEE